MTNSLHSTKHLFQQFNLLGLLLVLSQLGFSQSVSLPTDRARIAVASIPDYYGGPNLKVLRTDAGSPLRAGTAWIWEKQGQEEPASYYVSMRQKGLNAVRMILFDTWEVEAYQPSAQFTPTNWNDPVYRARQLARMERSVNYASQNGMYIIINSHNKIPQYNETYANALWTYVAPYFANRTHVIYEAANEPMSGIGTNGDMDMGAAGATNSPRLQALKRTYNIIRNGAPNTHIMILTPPGINDSAFGTGMGNLAASFAQLPGAVDWTKTSVAYHLYNNDRGFGNVAVNAANLRNLHSRYPGWPSENNFPNSVSNATLGITDEWRSAQFDNDIYVNQTCEKLGIGWSMWQINGQTQLDRNWPIMYADAVAKGWNWIPDPTTPDTQAPTVPTALVATNITANSLTLSWTAATDNIAVTNYEIFRNGISIGMTATATPTFNVAGLVCATSSNFTVKAKDAAGNTSAASSSISVTTSNCSTSFVTEAETNYTTVADVGGNCTVGPSNYAATTASNGLAVGLCDIGDEIKIAVNIFVTGTYDVQVRVRSGWAGSPMHFINNNKYEYRLNDVLQTFTYVPGSVTSVIDVDSYYGTVKLAGVPLTAGINYIRVKALESWAKVDFVRVDLLTTPDTQAPSVPAGLAASAVGGTGFSLSWAASTDNVGVTGYEVFRNGVSVGNTALTTFNITGLGCGTNSTMTVRARDAAGNWSSNSSNLNVSTTALPNAGTISGTTILCAGATTTLTSNGLAGGTWSSSNAAVATVNASGVVSGVSAGMATITYNVSANGCNSNTTSTVTINALPNAGTISGTTTVTTGSTTSLSSNGAAGGSWSSSNAAIATVSNSGVVSGVSVGTATITYTVTSNGCTRSVSATITVNAAVVTTTIVVRARSVGNAGASFRVEIMNSSAATGGTIVQNSSNFNNLPTTFANYTFTATGNINPNQIRVRYLNDMSPYDFETDYIIVNGTTYQTEATTTYSLGFWNVANECNNAGFFTNSLIQCSGYFHFLAMPTTTPIIVRARSVGNAGASFRVEIMNSSSATGGTVVQSSPDFTNLPTTFTNYTFNATGSINPNQIRVRYLNDMSPYDFETDYIIVNGTTYQTEAATTYSVGFWNAANGCNNAGFLTNSLIHCSGYFHFLATSGARLSAEDLEIEPVSAFGVYPNPAKDILNVMINANTEQQVDMRIIGTNGTVLRSFAEQVKSGKNTIRIPIYQLSEGSFILSAEYDNRRSTAKFTLIR
ncbi:MAG: T9SS C-terminal target domain-containing protein [Runella slithyformis]|nr:MAG: T9SS C-terminal target domain-containing protein [Runella slithyformis]